MLLANYPCKRLLEDCEGWVCVSASIGGVQVVHYAPDYLLDGRAAYTWQKQLKFHLCSLQFSTNKKINTVNKWKFDLPGAGVNGMTLLTRKFLLLQGQSATGKYVWDSNMKIWESISFAGDSTTAATLGAAPAAILGATTATQRQYYAAPPLWGKKSGIFDKVLLKKCPNGAKKAHFFVCGPQLWRKFSFSPPLPPLCDPKFYPSPRCILRVLHFLRHSFPLWKKVGAYVCMQQQNLRQYHKNRITNCLACTNPLINFEDKYNIKLLISHQRRLRLRRRRGGRRRRKTCWNMACVCLTVCDLCSPPRLLYRTLYLQTGIQS